MKKTLGVLLFLLVVAVFAPAQGYTSSLVADWSNTDNPNGLWSYNVGDTPLLYNQADWPAGEFGSTQTAWTNDWMPGWFKSVSTPDQTRYDWLAGDVLVHSSDSSGIEAYGQANVTWTSPLSALYDIDGGLWAGRDIGRSNDWNLYLDDTLLASGRVFSGDAFSRLNPDSFDFHSVDIREGSILKLEVLRSPDFMEDFVGVNLNINPITTPEPASLLLLGIGGVGLVLKRRLKNYRDTHEFQFFG